MSEKIKINEKVTIVLNQWTKYSRSVIVVGFQDGYWIEINVSQHARRRDDSPEEVKINWPCIGGTTVQKTQEFMSLLAVATYIATKIESIKEWKEVEEIEEIFNGKISIAEVQ